MTDSIKLGSDDIGLDWFIHLSKVLTGVEHLDRDLAAEYFNRLISEYPAILKDALAVFAAIPQDANFISEVRRQIFDDKTLGPFAREIIAIWYTSEFVGADGKSPKTGTQAQFNRGLLWRVIKAHAPANSKLKYGEWTNPPSP